MFASNLLEFNRRLLLLALTCSLGVLVGPACERGPVERICTPLEVGDLVISEIRPEQDDAWGQWFELYNPTAGSLELTGLRLRIMKLDGNNVRDLVLREHGLQVGAGGYFVMGRFVSGEQPDHVDYGYEVDFKQDLYATALVQLLGCNPAEPDDPSLDLVIDQVVYRSLPAAGSLGFDGALELSALANDEESDWCADPSEVEVLIDGVPISLPAGTPGARNRACP